MFSIKGFIQRSSNFLSGAADNILCRPVCISNMYISSAQNCFAALTKKSVSRKTTMKICTHFSQILVENYFMLYLILIGAYVLNTHINSLPFTYNEPVPKR